MWRFKTEEEFLAQYGEDWKRSIDERWNESGKMDYLFGKEIKPKYLERDGRPGIGHCSTISQYGIKPASDCDAWWSISRHMLIEVEDQIKEYYEIY
jgi:hypothetical protein